MILLCLSARAYADAYEVLQSAHNERNLSLPYIERNKHNVKALFRGKITALYRGTPRPQLESSNISTWYYEILRALDSPK